MSATSDRTLSFIFSLIEFFMLAIERAFEDSSVSDLERYVIAGIYTGLLVLTLFIVALFLKFLLTWIFRGVAALFAYIKTSLNDPQSLPYIGGLILLRSVPWYFSLLIIILFFCGICALFTNSQIWSESFKYILGATVGSLIGVVKKREEAEFENSLFDAAMEQTKKAQEKKPKQPE